MGTFLKYSTIPLERASQISLAFNYVFPYELTTNVNNKKHYFITVLLFLLFLFVFFGGAGGGGGGGSIQVVHVVSTIQSLSRGDKRIIHPRPFFAIHIYPDLIQTYSTSTTCR